MTTRAESATRNPGGRTLRVIALFKLTKVILCVVAALALLRLLSPGEPELVGNWIARLPMTPGRRIGERLLASFTGHGPDRLRLAAGIALGYATLFAIEGTGLWLRRRWAEYLTVVVTGTGIPVEIHEIVHRPSAISIGSLVINLLIVVYLIWRLRRDR